MMNQFQNSRSRTPALFGSGFLLSLWLVLCAGVAAANAAGDPPAAVHEKEQQLIAILRSDAAPAEKAITCKRLAIYGSADAVPALAPLLADAHLASWARIALEAIPGPEAEAALRQAAGQVHGELLVGVLNSIAVKRDRQAIPVLSANLAAPDSEVACAAAVALGRVGGSSAAKALTRSLPKAPAEVRSAIAQGCTLCAEQFLSAGEYGTARKLYDTVRSADLPQQRLLEATRGAILARRAAGVPLLLEQLRSPNKAFFNVGLSTARELPGPEATKALVAELGRCEASRQPRLLLALADRKDPAVWPALVEVVQHGTTKDVRVVAVEAVERSGNRDSLPVLLGAALDADPAIAKAALASLTRLPGNEVNAEMLARLQTGDPRERPVLLKLAGLRHIDAALPVAADAMNSAEPATRAAAIQAVSSMGGAPELRRLVQMLGSSGAGQRAEVESALLDISGRQGAAGAPELLPLMKSNDPAMRVLGIHALAAAGGPDGLAGVTGALNDPEESVQDEAARTLAAWPNTWPEDSAAAEQLLQMAHSTQKPSYQVLAVRGYLQFLQGDTHMSSDQKAEKISAVMPLLQRPEEKSLALTILAQAVSHQPPGKPWFESVSSFSQDSALAEDAWAAMLEGVSKAKDSLSQDERRKALQLVVEKSTSEATRKKAEAALGKLQ